MIAPLLALLLAAEPGPGSAPAPRWPRPWVVFKLNGEFPYGIGPGIELWPHELASIGTDVNFSQAGTFYRVSAHFWPELPSARTAHQFLLGVGSDASVTFSWPPGGAGFIVGASVDLRYLGRPVPAFGFVAGTRLGAGVSFDTNDFASGGRRAIDHLALSAIAYIGVALETGPRTP